MPPAVWRDDLDRNTLARLIEALPLHLRTVARLRFQMRWPRAAIAETLGLPHTTVVGRVTRAHEAIDRLEATGAAQMAPSPNLVRRALMHFAGMT